VEYNQLPASLIIMQVIPALGISTTPKQNPPYINATERGSNLLSHARQ
jgi:hypothetical protein